MLDIKGGIFFESGMALLRLTRIIPHLQSKHFFALRANVKMHPVIFLNYINMLWISTYGVRGVHTSLSAHEKGTTEFETLSKK